LLLLGPTAGQIADYVAGVAEVEAAALIAGAVPGLVTFHDEAAIVLCGITFALAGILRLGILQVERHVLCESAPTSP
jgi:hypothetical protein